MSGNDSAAAIAALISAGIILLNIGVSMIQAGDLYNGLMVMVFGVALIFAAIFITKTMMLGIAKRFKSPS